MKFGNFNLNKNKIKMGLLNSLLHIHTYGKIDEKGYQYCTACNKSFYVGILLPESTWKIHERVEFTNKENKIHKITFVQECIETGELKSFSIRS